LDRLRRLSVSARLVAIAALTIVALALAAWAAQAALTAQLAARVIDPQLDAALNDAMLKAAPDAEGAFAITAALADARFEQEASGRYLQVMRLGADGEAQIVWRSASLNPASIEIKPEQLTAAAAPQSARDSASGTRYLTLDKGLAGAPLRVATRTALLPGFADRHLVIVAADPSPETQALGASLARITAALVAVCAAVVVLGAIVQAWAGIAPIFRLSADVADVRRGQSDRLAGPYPEELARLADELNALVNHNREVVERARRHVGNLAHALKTPIAVLRNAAAKGDANGAVAPAVEEMERFVERQLRRARVAARAEAAAGPQAPTIAYRTPVAANVADLIFMMEQKYDQKAMDIALVAGPDPTFRGEREDLLEMCANLIDNACKYGRSQVRVSLAAPQPGRLEIIVEDDGPGLDDAQLAAAMQRGARLDEAAPGQGLGLSILAETVALYEGGLAFGRSELGGLRAVLSLPATD
jgi:signal transduction histidine kinase